MDLIGIYYIPSGKLTVCYRKSKFLIGKTNNKWSFSLAMLNYHRVRSRVSKGNVMSISEIIFFVPI